MSSRTVLHRHRRALAGSGAQASSCRSRSRTVIRLHSVVHRRPCASAGMSAFVASGISANVEEMGGSLGNLGGSRFLHAEVSCTMAEQVITPRCSYLSPHNKIIPRIHRFIIYDETRGGCKARTSRMCPDGSVPAHTVRLASCRLVSRTTDSPIHKSCIRSHQQQLRRRSLPT